MPSPAPAILYVTDLGYQARGRRYCDEDIFLSGLLRADFTVALCHPLQATALMDDFDAVVVRNSGPVMQYQAEYAAFRSAALSRGTRVYNPLTGRADMIGKQYLVDLTLAGYPVIPTVDRYADLHRLPDVAEYVVKPAAGADSIGLRTVSREQLDRVEFDGLLAQPKIDFRYEVSFYFVDHELQYALHAPDPDQRWLLRRYDPTPADRDFAHRFVDWNGLSHGIQRVDACRTADGELLLVELEDLNPYLSLDLVDEDTRTAFVASMRASIRDLLSR
ncbi:hypothetical protein [Micromonospora sp. NPDC004704]